MKMRDKTTKQPITGDSLNDVLRASLSPSSPCSHKYVAVGHYIDDEGYTVERAICEKCKLYRHMRMGSFEIVEPPKLFM